MKKIIYKIYISILKFYLKCFQFSLLEKKENHSVLIFADGTYESNALMLVPVANKLKEKKIDVTFVFEYGYLKEKELEKLLDFEINQISIKKFRLVKYFSLYNSSSLKRKIGFFTYPIVLLRLILKIKPSYILVANDIMMPSKTLVNFCKHIQIPTLSLQHGALCEPFFPIEADKLGVYSEGVKNFIEKNNLADKNKIVSLGNPRWDNLKTYIKNKEIPTNHTILILSQATSYKDAKGIVDENIEGMFNLVERIAKQFPNIEIIVKLHPLENSILWNQKVNFLKYNNLKLFDEDLISALTKSTICISGATTAFIEAALFGLKCIGYRPYKATIAVPKETEMDYFIKIFEDYNLLIEEVKKTIFDNNKNFQIDKNYILDHFGNSAEYISKYIISEIVK